MLTLISGVRVNYYGGPGSDWLTRGMARLTKLFLTNSNFLPNTLFTSSIVYSPAITAVVVARAGTILPAFSFTSIHSISFKA
jgi:hypothetical protein